jgi:hypothetical protein
MGMPCRAIVHAEPDNLRFEPQADWQPPGRDCVSSDPDAVPFDSSRQGRAGGSIPEVQLHAGRSQKVSLLPSPMGLIHRHAPAAPPFPRFPTWRYPALASGPIRASGVDAPLPIVPCRGRETPSVAGGGGVSRYREGSIPLRQHAYPLYASAFWCAFGIGRISPCSAGQSSPPRTPLAWSTSAR